MALNLSSYMGNTAASAMSANPYAAAFGAAASVGTAALDDKTNMTNQAAIGAMSFMFGDHSVNLGAGSIDSTKSMPQALPASLAAAGAAGASLLSNPLVLGLLALVAYKAFAK